MATGPGLPQKEPRALSSFPGFYKSLTAVCRLFRSRRLLGVGGWDAAEIGPTAIFVILNSLSACDPDHGECDSKRDSLLDHSRLRSQLTSLERRLSRSGSGPLEDEPRLVACPEPFFCSQRCRDWYDSGNPDHAQDWLKRAKDGAAPTLRDTLRALSGRIRELIRRHRERQDNVKLMSEVGIEPSRSRNAPPISPLRNDV